MSDEVSRLKPVIVLPTGSMSREDIELLRQDGLMCVVECEQPEAVRFLEPPPNDYSQSERAAIQLFRQLMSRERRLDINGYGIASMYVDILTSGTTLERIPPVTRAKKGKQ